MSDEKYCRAGEFRCDHHKIVVSASDHQWDCCCVETNHTTKWERCPYPAKSKNLGMADNSNISYNKSRPKCLCKISPVDTSLDYDAFIKFDEKCPVHGIKGGTSGN